mmetsp:Transcript_10516/g.29923  ORF Transcript_10516/g.29923 Transcript_10516/m.29923 type:complete len:470 (+) Transcript_10516:53-1462(+)
MVGSRQEKGASAAPSAPTDRAGELSGIERVLKCVKRLYDAGLSDGAVGAAGLTAIANDKTVGRKITRPRSKVSVMIVGNHSSSKSSFINWYIGEHIQRTGVAIETRGFAIVTSGKRRETLTGDATMRYFDYLEGLDQFPGIKSNLLTEVSTSTARSFNCVNFIDTPGLVDGDMQYPFNVQDVIVWMADHVDLILVFFDPIGQATCKRCMEVVERLNKTGNLEKIHYFMSKADEVEKEHDRQRVLIQITQNLTPRIRNMHGFDLPTFYLPSAKGESAQIPNSIEEVCGTIDKAVGQTVQKTLNNLAEDCKTLVVAIDKALAVDLDHHAHNRSRRAQGICLNILAAFMLAWMAWVSMEEWLSTTPGKALLAMVAEPWRSQVLLYMPDTTRAQRGPAVLGLVREGFLYGIGVMFGMFLTLYLTASITWTIKPLLSRKDLNRLMSFKGTVIAISKQEGELYKDYLRSISLEDA